MFEDSIMKSANADPYIHRNGIRFTVVKEGYAEAEVDVTEDGMNPMGALHGGLMFSMMDALATVAGLTHGNVVTTVDAHIHFLNRVAGSKKIRGVTREAKNGKTLLVHDVFVYDDNDVLVAQGTFTNCSLFPIGDEKAELFRGRHRDEKE